MQQYVIFFGHDQWCGRWICGAQVAKVTVERQPKSLWDFECSFEDLRGQQHALLVLHKVSWLRWDLFEELFLPVLFSFNYGISTFRPIYHSIIKGPWKMQVQDLKWFWSVNTVFLDVWYFGGSGLWVQKFFTAFGKKSATTLDKCQPLAVSLGNPCWDILNCQMVISSKTAWVFINTGSISFLDCMCACQACHFHKAT